MRRLVSIPFILLALHVMSPSILYAVTPFSYIWSGFSTSLSGRSDEQRHNAALAGRELDGVVIPPGKVFSFNDNVGARDRAKGYAAAPFLNGQGVLEETPGGGICQLASTIYNAGLLAGMEVVERHPHSRSVAHVPPGRDATIASWRKDLKLRNPFPHPLILKISSDNGRLTASFRSVVEKDFQVEIRSEQTPLEPETIAPRSTVKGQPGTQGFSATVRCIIKKNGNETDQLISEDVYPAPSRILAGGEE